MIRIQGIRREVRRRKLLNLQTMQLKSNSVMTRACSHFLMFHTYQGCTRCAVCPYIPCWSPVVDTKQWTLISLSQNSCGLLETPNSRVPTCFVASSTENMGSTFVSIFICLHDVFIIEGIETLEDFHELHKYSVEHDEFWLDLWEFLGIISSIPPNKVRLMIKVMQLF